VAAPQHRPRQSGATLTPLACPNDLRIRLHSLSLELLNLLVYFSAPQEPVLFACSIRDNLTYGVDNIRDEQIDEVCVVRPRSGSHQAFRVWLAAQACRVANAYDFIHKLPDGYQTTVGERGIRLSGGEFASLCLSARLLLRPAVFAELSFVFVSRVLICRRCFVPIPGQKQRVVRFHIPSCLFRML
jgi:hypothetical protein